MVTTGELAAVFGPLTISECWGSDFARVYYKDSSSPAAVEGDPSACAVAAR
jgi:hypothetical protein